MKNISNTEEPWDYVFCIDWSAIETFYALQHCNYILATVPLISLVFRIFSRSQELLKSIEDQQFYIEKEADAVIKSDLTIVLSHVDKFSLQRIHGGKITSNGKQKDFLILPPPLRFDFREQCHNSIYTTNERKYITCNVRLSPEKNAILFAKIMKRLAEKQILQKLQLTPLMIGAICDVSYAKEVKAHLPPETVIVERFLSSSELMRYLSETFLMIHPPTYDAYGMTIAEAAAIGTPTIIHEESIGASSLFQASKGEIILGDLSTLDNALDSIEKVLLHSSPNYLRQVGETARHKALSWTVTEYAKALQVTLKDIV
jgi:glycosyltransferase involved in cell wall biosynthesis